MRCIDVAMGRHRKGQQRVFTVGDLIAELRRFDSGLEVRLATQPRLPQEHRLTGVAEADGALWIGGSDSRGYAPDEVAEELGWR